MALTDKLTALGDAIRSKTGKTEKLTLDQMATEIADIQTGGGDDASITRAIIDRSITEFSDDVLTKVGEYAFNKCLNLVFVNLPNVTTMDSYAFFGCKNLKHVYGAKITQIPSYCFHNTQIETLDVSRVEKIENMGLTGQFETLNFSSLKTMAVGAIQTCQNLKTVYMPVIEDFGYSQFSSCEKLENLYLPATPPTTSGNPFSTYRVNDALKVHIPAGSLTAYQNATNWSAAVDKYTFVEDA